MGFLGLFIGPVLMALLVAIWREWIREIEITNAQPAPVQDADTVTPLPQPGEPPRARSRM